MFEGITPVDTPQEFKDKANLTADKYRDLVEKSKNHPLAFWENLARDSLKWSRPFTRTYEHDGPFVRWFSDGELNACVQCLDEPIARGLGSKTALIWEGEACDFWGRPEERRAFSFQELFEEVCAFSEGLTNLGVMAGDCVALYLPMLPEAVIAMLACSRIGAVHTVIFSGFSADAVRERVINSGAKILITADGGFRRGKFIPLKRSVDDALFGVNSVCNVIVVDRLGQCRCSVYKTKIADSVPMTPGRDVWFHDISSKNFLQKSPSFFPSEHPLFVLYTSGSTGKPKGIVHSTAGYILWVKKTFEWVFDAKANDVFFCTADVGWITGHSYVVYGPLSNGMTTCIYEGAPDTPSWNRFWKIIEREKVTIFYTAPTAIRSFMKQGNSWPGDCDLSSLRLLGSVGEPINPEAWRWYFETVGGSRCPVVDTWWQTETGGIMMTCLPAVMAAKPGCAMTPLPGIQVEVVNAEGFPLVFVAESAVIGVPDEIKGNSICAFVTLKSEFLSELSINDKKVKLIAALKKSVSDQIGAFARPDEIRFSESLPKTRSGKIMRRLLRDIASEKMHLGDTTTLEDMSVLIKLKEYQNDDS